MNLPPLTLAQRVLLARAVADGTVRTSSGYPPAKTLERRGFLQFVQGTLNEPGEQVAGASRFARSGTQTSVLVYAVTDAGRSEWERLRREYDEREAAVKRSKAGSR